MINCWGGLKSPSLPARVCWLRLWAQAKSVFLRADLLSKEGPLASSVLQIVEQIWLCFGRAEVGLFAIAESTHCSPWSPPGPLETEALSLSWSYVRLIVFSPLPILTSFFRRVSLLCALVAPNCPQRPSMVHIYKILEDAMGGLPASDGRCYPRCRAGYGSQVLRSLSPQVHCPSLSMNQLQWFMKM